MIHLVVLFCSFYFSNGFHFGKWLKFTKSSTALTRFKMSSLDDVSNTIEKDFVGRTLYCNLKGFGVESLNPCIELNEKSAATFSNGVSSYKPGFWRIIEDKTTNIATIEITHPVPPEYLLFFDIWEQSILWKGDIDMKTFSSSTNLKLLNGRVTTNKKRLGIIPYVDTIAAFDAIIYNRGDSVPKAILPKFSKQSFLAPIDFDSPYDMKRYPQFFDPEFVEYFFSVEEALAKGQEPPPRPKAFFTPNSATEEKNISSNESSVNATKKGFKVSRK